MGVAAIAEDGARVYYVSRVAIGGKNPENEGAKAGEPNLYVYDALTGRTAFIATLNTTYDEEDWRREFPRSVQVTGENGRFALFVSAEGALTSDDTKASGVSQLFEYAAQEERKPAELVRVTKGENGFNENGNNVSVGVAPSSIIDPMVSMGRNEDFKGDTNRLNISDDGRTVVFATAGQLSQYATSAASECTSVYEFREDVGFSNGTVSLISDGADLQPFGGTCGAQFEGMDGSGENILFSTADSLVPGDLDGTERDLYDGRVGGGVAAPADITCSVARCASGPQTVPDLPEAGGGSSLTQEAEGGLAPVVHPVSRQQAKKRKSGRVKPVAAPRSCSKRRREQVGKRCEKATRRSHRLPSAQRPGRSVEGR